MNYVKYKEKEVWWRERERGRGGGGPEKSVEFSLYFIIHHTPTCSQNKLDLLGSPAHSGSKSSEICTRILITLCLDRNEKSNTYTHPAGEREREIFLVGWREQYIAPLMEASVFHVSAHFTGRGRAIGVTTAPPIGKAEDGKLWLFLPLPQPSVFSLPSQIKTCSAENQIKDASPWQIARLIIYLGKHERKDARERKRHRRRDTGGMARRQRGLISGT